MSQPAHHRAQALMAHLTASSSAVAAHPAAGNGGKQERTLQQHEGGCFDGPHPYTLDPMGVLTPEQRRQYDEQGFLLVRNLVSADEIEKWRQRFVDIANGVVEPTATMLVMRDVAIAKKKEKGEHAITKLQDWQDDEVLFSYTSHPAVAKYVESIIGSDFKSVHTMLINKPPDVGLGSSRHPPHQDLWYFPFRPAHKIVASWTAMQKIDKENGCLFVQPGTHKGDLHLHKYPNDGIVNKAYHGIHSLSEADTAGMLHVEMDVGDTLFFHPLLIHGSGRNLSKRYRKAISCHYASTSCQFIKVTGTMQQDIAREIEEIIKRKGFEGVSFNDVWRMKSRLIQGKEGTL